MALLHVVEDDSAIRESLCLALEAEGFEVRASAEGSGVLAAVEARKPDLMLLDLRLPGIDGLSLCRKLRAAHYYFPIIILSARDEDIDRITGLETGADDYLVKPYNFRELVSRVRACLRRAGEYSGPQTSARAEYKFGAIRVDARALRVFRRSASGGTGASARNAIAPGTAEDSSAATAESEIFLTPIELRILLEFLENPGVILRREAIIAQVWGPGVFLEDERTVDVHIRHLREKIEEDPANPAHITTVRGFGYRFEA